MIRKLKVHGLLFVQIIQKQRQIQKTALDKKNPKLCSQIQNLEREKDRKREK